MNLRHDMIECFVVRPGGDSHEFLQIRRSPRRYMAGKPDRCLLTDVLDEKPLSAESAGVLYGLRWGVEVGFGGIKRTMRQHTPPSDAPVQAKLELEWVLMSFWVLGLLSVQRVIEEGHDPLSWSVALALRAVRRQMRRWASPTDDRADALGRAVQDDDERHGPKAIRHRPRKRDQHPPGEPKIVAVHGPAGRSDGVGLSAKWSLML
jgi:hypothetical protein